MNYKALALSFLLLLPLFAIPISLANQPPPQAWNVEYSIKPIHTKFWGPCTVSTVFPVDVFLWNDKSLTGVGVYAYDFYVYWHNNVGISLNSLVYHIPWPSGKFFVVKNETGTYIPDATYSFYHLAVTAVGNSTIDPSLELGALGLFNASLVTLSFHIDKEPCWPDQFTTGIYIGNELGANIGPEFTTPPGSPSGDVALYPHSSTGCTATINNTELINGDYTLLSSQPNIDPLVSGDDPGRVSDYIFKEDSIGETHTIVVALSNVTNAYGFMFHLTWDADWYDTDIQHVTILPAFAPPYETLQMTVTPGELFIRLVKPSEKPTICAKGYLPVVTITLVTTNEPMVGEIPVAFNTTFQITYAELDVKCPDLRVYTPTTGLLISGPIIQMFVPKSSADLNIDGVVDVADLAAIAKLYGQASPWAALVAPPGNVDIFDIVFVAKRYLDP